MKKDSLTVSRRGLLGLGLKGAVAVPAAAALVSLAEKSLAADAPIGDDKLLKDTDPVGKALKYVPDASKSSDRKAPRMGVKAEDQHCSNCAQYKKEGQLKSGDEVGKCTMLPSGLVKGKGWCNSWSKKA